MSAIARLLLLILIVTGFALAQAPAGAEPRTALVIGNGGYAQSPLDPGPLNLPSWAFPSQ